MCYDNGSTSFVSGAFMKKYKKYTYPLFFSVAFLVYYTVCHFLLGYVIPFPNGSYAPAALFVLLIFAWLIIVLPICCIRYSGIIMCGRLKVLFCACNSLLIFVSHTLPFDLYDENRIMTHFVLWVLFWNTVPLVCRLVLFKKR